MSIIFKALQKSKQKQKLDNEKITIITEKKKNKPVFLIILLLILPFFVLFSFLFIQMYSEPPVQKYPSALPEEPVIFDQPTPAHQQEETPSPSILPEPTQTGRMFFLEDLRKQPQPDDPINNTPSPADLSSKKDISIAEPKLEAIEEKFDEFAEKHEEYKKPIEPLTTKEQQRVYSSSIDYSLYKLQGVAGNEKGYTAIINEKIVGEGDFINGAKIVRITSNFVELTINGEYFLIYQ